MGDLIVKASYQFTEREILTADKLNLLGTPVVELALTDPVNDQSFFRNGNFYSSFWKTPAGITCPAGVWTTNASYWLCRPDITSPFSSLTASFVQPAVLGTTSGTLTAAFTQPAANATVPIALTATAWMSVNQTITIVGGGEYTVSSITDTTHAVVKNLGLTGNAAPTASVPTGGAVGPTSLVTISVGATAWMSPTQLINIVGGGDYRVSSLPDGTHAIVSNLGHPANVSPGSTVASGGGITPLSAAVTFLRSTQVPDIYSLFSGEIQGAGSVASVEFGQQIGADLAATLRRKCTFSGYIYNGSGLVSSPKLNFYTADTFNNFATITLQTTVNVQSAPPSSWTFMTATLDLTIMPNVANGLLIAILLPSGTLNDPMKYVLFSRLKFQVGEVATEFVDDTSLFIQTPSVDSTMLQDGCIARPSLFLPNVIPAGAYQAKSIKNGDIDDGAIDGRTLQAGANTTLTSAFNQPAVSSTVSIAVVSTTGFLAGQAIKIAVGGAYTVSSVTDATHMVVVNSGAAGNAAPATSVPTGGAVTRASAAIANLGFTPVNKAGDTGVGALQFNNDDVVGTTSYLNGAIKVTCSAAQASNAGYMPAIGFERPGVMGRAIGLGANFRFLAPFSSNATAYYLLDSYFGVANADINAGAITIDKLAQSLINILCPPGIMAFFSGPNPPTGWLICDGSEVLRTGATAALFTAIGTYWGPGNNSNTFNLPDLQGRVPMGYVNRGATGITAHPFAQMGGSEKHQLTIAELALHDHTYAQTAHTHNVTVGAHTHTVTNPVGTQIGVVSGANLIFYPSGQINTSAAGGGGATDAQLANITFAGQGGNQPHDQMQPYAVGYWIIKY